MKAALKPQKRDDQDGAGVVWSFAGGVSVSRLQPSGN
jgi:hypothetical protein